MENTLLIVNNLKTYFNTASGTVRAVDGVSFSVDKGQALGIVGESGSGKSVTANSVIKLLPPNANIEGGEVSFKGQRIDNLPEKEMRKLRGQNISMIFQDPMTSLDPVFTIGNQMLEGILAHKNITSKDAENLAVVALESVGITNAKRRLKAYPHEFSGGMRQRVMIAMATVLNPELIIADEPTTALDVTVQAQVLNIISDLQHKYSTGVILITHDLGVIWQMCDEVMVMYAGKTVEKAPVKDLYDNHKHPYTQGLINSIPKLDMPSGTELDTIPGSPPDLKLTGKGCNFRYRCPYSMPICAEVSPDLVEISSNHFTACHLYDQDVPADKTELPRN